MMNSDLESFGGVWKLPTSAKLPSGFMESALVAPELLIQLLLNEELMLMLAVKERYYLTTYHLTIKSRLTFAVGLIAQVTNGHRVLHS